jgi:hypothetical protein
MIKDTRMQTLAKALLLQEWFQVMKKEHSKEMAEKFYYAYILSKNHKVLKIKDWFFKKIYRY